MKITPAQDIISAAITAALQPFKAQLAAACERDVQLAAEAEKIHPDKCKAQGFALMEAAVAGNEAAMRELEGAGGLDAWIAGRAAVYPIREGARHHHACDSAELFERAAAKLIPALEKAGADIQAQFEQTMTALGELPGGLSQWDAAIRAKIDGINGAVQQGKRGVGLAYLVQGLGLREHLS
jgi:hypothetical protein